MVIFFQYSKVFFLFNTVVKFTEKAIACLLLYIPHIENIFRIKHCLLHCHAIKHLQQNTFWGEYVVNNQQETDGKITLVFPESVVHKNIRVKWLSVQVWSCMQMIPRKREHNLWGGGQCQVTVGVWEGDGTGWLLECCVAVSN